MRFVVVGKEWHQRAAGKRRDTVCGVLVFGRPFEAWVAEPYGLEYVRGLAAEVDAGLTDIPTCETCFPVSDPDKE